MVDEIRYDIYIYFHYIIYRCSNMCIIVHPLHTSFNPNCIVSIFYIFSVPHITCESEKHITHTFKRCVKSVVYLTNPVEYIKKPQAFSD